MKQRNQGTSSKDMNMNTEHQKYFAPICTMEDWNYANPVEKQDYAVYAAERAVYYQYKWDLFPIEQAYSLLVDVFYDWDGREAPMLWDMENAMYHYEDYNSLSADCGAFADNESNEIYICSGSMYVPMVLHEAAHILVPAGPAHCKEWRDVKDLLLKRYANIDPALPAEAQCLNELLDQLEEPAAEWWARHDQIIRDDEP